MDEPEPPVEEAALDDVTAGLDAVSFPATGDEVVAAVGDREVEAADGSYPVSDLVPDTDAETFDTPAAVRTRVRRPTVAAALKRVVEASDALHNETLAPSQRDAYEKTLRALAAVAADDEDEGVRVVADWLVAQIRDEGTLPDSRAVRRRAAAFCRANGYPVRNDEWLGV